MDDLWTSGASLGGPRSISIDFGCDYGVLGTLFLDEDRALGHDFSIHAFGVVPGRIFLGFMIGQGALEHEKPCKFIVLSFKIKG